MAVNSEFPEEQGSERPDFHRYLDVARRRHMRWVAGSLGGWLGFAATL